MQNCTHFCICGRGAKGPNERSDTDKGTAGTHFTPSCGCDNRKHLSTFSGSGIKPRYTTGIMEF